jgi:hypothetical protein
MSSDGNNDLAHKYPAGAIADSPIPFSQENPNTAAIHVPTTCYVTAGTFTQRGFSLDWSVTKH